MSVKTWLRYLISISIIIFAAIAFNCSNDQQSAQESQEKIKYIILEILLKQKGLIQ